MSLGQEEEKRMKKELLEVLERIDVLQIRHLGVGVIGSLGNTDSSDGDSFIKLVEGIVRRRLQCAIQPVLEDLILRLLLKETNFTLLSLIMICLAKEVIATALETILAWNPANELHSMEQSRLQLKFKYKLRMPVWTGEPIKNEVGTPIEISLVDSLTGVAISSGPEASAKLEILVLKGDYDFDGGLDSEWFSQNIVKQREENNKSLLGGDIYVQLKEGIGCVGEIHFAHSSIWMKNGKFKLGARIVDDIYGTKARAAVTESFIIRDRRVKLYEKHEIPSLSDEVWRLKHISRRGGFYKRLIEGNIKTVQEFLTEHFINPQNLQKICGKALVGKKFEETVFHALKCGLVDRYKYYSTCAPQKTAAIFNVVGQLLGALYETHYVPIDELSEDQKIVFHELVVSAFKHWGDVIPLNKNFPEGDVVLNAFCAQNSHEPESFEQHNNATHILIDNQENNFSSIYDQGFTSSHTSDWSANFSEDFDIHSPLSSFFD